MTSRSHFSRLVKPGDDFYTYVNEPWIKSHPIPASKSRVSAMNDLSDLNDRRIEKLVTSPIAHTDSANIQLVKKLYSLAMDTDSIEKAGALPIQPLIDDADTIQTVGDVQACIAAHHSRGIHTVWNLSWDIDDKDSSRYVIRIYQGGLGLPDRDYYLEDTDEFIRVRDEYKKFLRSLFKLLGKDSFELRADRVFELETKLARLSDTAIERRDVEKQYNIYKKAELQKSFPSVEWGDYLQTTGLNEASELVVSAPKFLDGASSLTVTEPVDTWRDYLLAHSVMPFMTTLSKAFVRLHFSFFVRVLSGSTRQLPRKKRVIARLVDILPDPIGELYVSSHFDEDSKKAIYHLVDTILEAMRKRIEHLEWMSDATKLEAFNKLASFSPLLGYPDRWRDYSSLDIGTNYTEAIMNLRAFEWEFDKKRILRPVDRDEWHMSPALVNAYYLPNTNSITFPAAILQPPFFDAKGDFAANYGAIGMVIGHEITHGFDDKGSLFDADGQLKLWWTDDDRAAFDERARQLVDQYDAYQIDGQHVKGELTLGENIADLGGMLIAYDAMLDHIKQTGDTAGISGLSPQQRFFVAHARAWRTNIRPEMALRFLVSDPHSPAHLRVNGVVTNIDAFYDAFDVDTDQDLYKSPQTRVRIW